MIIIFFLYPDVGVGGSVYFGYVVSPILKFYSLCHVYYRFSALAVNVGT